MKRTLHDDQAAEGQPTTRTPIAEEDSSALTAADIVQMVLRRIWFIVACMVICGLIGYLVTRLTKPTYEASASIRIDPGRANSLGFSDLLSGNSADTSDLARTEIAIMQSDQVSINTLNSLSDKEYSALTGEPRNGYIPLKSSDITKQQEKQIGSFKSHLSVKPVIETQLVAISFKDKDPVIAATVVNRLVDTYLKQNFDNRYGSVLQVEDWLSGQMTGLKSRAQDAQQKLAQFQEQHNILGTGAPGIGGQDTSTTTTDRLRMLNERLTNAEADRIVKEAQMRAAMTNDPAVLASLFPDQKFQSLQTQQATLYTQFAQLSTKFGPQYAPLVQIQEQLKVINAEIKRNTEQVRTRLKEDYDAAQGSETMLRNEYEAQTGKAYALNREQAELSNLQAEGSASNQLYNTLQVKLQQAGVDAGLNGVNTMRVDVARPPLAPTGPGKSTTVLAATMLGLILGLASVFVVEFTSERIQNPTQMEGATGAAIVGLIPHDASVSQSAGAPSTSLVALASPYSRQTEAYRSLRNLLFRADESYPLKSLLIASAAPDEGKTVITSNLAVVLAQAGSKVLVVDAELARPSLERAFACQNAMGLPELFKGAQARFVHPVESLPNLSLLGAGQSAGLNPDALSKYLPSLLRTWEQEFDYLLIKAAPLLLVSDGLVLAKHVHGTLLIGRRDVSSIKELEEVADRLRVMNGHVAGLVLNDATGLANEKGKYEKYGSQHGQ